MHRVLAVLLVGLIFGVGIALLSMANPVKVLNFFDFAGTWNPPLGVVMGDALIVTAIGYAFVLRRKAPVFDRVFHLPTWRVSVIAVPGCLSDRWSGYRLPHRCDPHSCESDIIMRPFSSFQKLLTK